MISIGNNFNYYPENQLTKNSVEQELGAPTLTLGVPLDFVYPAASFMRRCQNNSSVTVSITFSVRFNCVSVIF